ncbi:MAG: N-acetyl-alpha-D-glucosaminyl L-malate synthase BshA [Chitinophagaceae bacterium]|jgi:N-acetyl-alpha-D-glucosaminyl L-malate synthase BshA|nr:N-acetyl-alpha-D-glucosaminyl L-malate synthase BshA [Chitinophagaceae bacterium]MBK9383139.1 N-acetyl-alpha-D-glucosaminyl L-malate synthase BshA [Chitinophagaceae bacterium]MBL0305844.1 N-acetyl-alpha-D-glucosaminyl L-malate synthase BshA [Chitinophagaceae bacterium]MBP6215564.1 N-acetyl-alpha-D-glucosaminyl L-malate synthase BshA [Chitinophagaceae bacterium]HQV59785.1 N-acetyl-alpha-D-glucosaminyl L-malate synthase BshA [Chitinophagaceae bacterium]
MKIGIVCYPTFGGSGVLATELGKALAQKGHMVHFITYQQPVRLSEFMPNIFYHEVQVPTYPLFDYPPYETALSSTMVDVIKNHDLDLLHVHYAIPHASAAFMAKQILKKEGKNIPVITTLHGTDITLVGRDKMYAPVVTFSINESDGITAVSENLRDETYKHFQIEKDIEVIVNFVDVSRFNRKPIDAFRKVIAPNGERILLHASNFRKIKRVQDVVKIFAEVSKQIPSKLLFVGDGPERSTAEDLSRELGVCDEIRFVGKQEQMEDILAIGDLFLLTSEYESFGLAALEAMAAGVPVISTNAGGLGEINIPGETGYMSNVGDVENMSKQAISILQDDDTLKGFKERAAEHAKKFDIHNIVPLYEKLYEKFL